jgi:hypothetical protein
MGRKKGENMTILGQSLCRAPITAVFKPAPPAQKSRTPLASARENAQPWSMSPSKPLIIVANAFERERKLARQAPARIMWTRAELTDLLGCYGRHVAAGIWRDYAIDDGTEHASFSVFRHSSEVPLYIIEKIPALRRKQGEYCVRGMDRRVLRRGHTLDALLRFFDRKSLRVLS